MPIIDTPSFTPTPNPPSPSAPISMRLATLRVPAIEHAVAVGLVQSVYLSPEGNTGHFARAIMPEALWSHFLNLQQDGEEGAYTFQPVTTSASEGIVLEDYDTRNQVEIIGLCVSSVVLGVIRRGAHMSVFEGLNLTFQRLNAMAVEDD